MIDLGTTHHCLNIEVNCDLSTGWIRISQPLYITQKLFEINMENYQSISTLMIVGAKLSSEDSPNTPEEIEKCSKYSYKNASGSLNWEIVCTHPNIAYIVNEISKFMSNLGELHVMAIKRVFHYLKRTISYSIEYRRSNYPIPLMGFSDADWAGNTDNKRSNYGYIFLLSKGIMNQLVQQTTTQYSTFHH